MIAACPHRHYQERSVRYITPHYVVSQTQMSESMGSLFDERLIPKCHDRLEKAKEALFNCENAKTFDQYASYWSSFLINTGGVLNALDTGSRKSAQARQWYGLVKKQGRADPLVSYMHQSRNAEEHGPESQSAPRGFFPIGVVDTSSGEENWDMGIDWGSAELGPDGGITYKTDPNWMDKYGHWNFLTGSPPSPVALRPAVDEKFKQVFWPPHEHKGRPISSSDPLTVGRLYLSYLDELVSKAEEMS